MRLYLDRSGKTKRVDQLPFLELNIPRTGDKNYSVSGDIYVSSLRQNHLKIRVLGHGLEIILKLESRLTVGFAIEYSCCIPKLAYRNQMPLNDATK